MKFRFLSLVAAALAAPALALAADKCPISGEDVDPAVSLQVNDKTVGFCCKKCLAKYQENLKVVDEGAAKCPVSKEDADAEQRIIHVTTAANFFCCEKCMKKFSDEKKLTVSDEGPAKCPLSGEDASADQSVNVDGKVTYFCCDKCKAKFVAGLKAANAEPGKCPLSGEDADPSKVVYTTAAKAVYFCCGKCKAKYVETQFAKAE